MLKQELANPADAQAISATSTSGVINTSTLELELLKLNVNEHVEKKQNLSYLSWAWAWAEALKADPNANFQVHLFGDKSYMEVNGTAMVWVTVMLGGRTRTCWLPVMNAKNNPITIDGRRYKDKYGNEQVEKLDSFNVNTAIMRCLTKCLALFGLGLYIYAGEDLPEGEEVVKEEAPKPKNKVDVDSEDGQKKLANLNLFADGMMQYVGICKDGKALRSYWKANQTQIEELKSLLPTRYEELVAFFSKANNEFKEKEQSNG